MTSVELSKHTRGIGPEPGAHVGRGSPVSRPPQFGVDGRFILDFIRRTTREAAARRHAGRSWILRCY